MNTKQRLEIYSQLPLSEQWNFLVEHQCDKRFLSLIELKEEVLSKLAQKLKGKT